MSAGANFYFKPQDGEHIETTVSLTPEARTAIHGTVVGGGGAPVFEAIVMLFTSGGGGVRKLIGRQFTDTEGHFCFGPLEGGVLYQIKIYKNDVKLRELEIIAEST